MDAKQLLILTPLVITLLLHGRAMAEQTQEQYVQLAILEIDPARLEDYKAAVREQIEAAIRVEPGVLVLQAVAEKDDPTRITVLEVYASTEAYRSHLEAPHFKKYKATTDEMVKSLKLIQTVPVMLGAKPK